MKRWVRRMAVALLIAMLTFGGAVAPASAATAVSDTGRAAIDDLRTCLSSSNTLNVYYLIDNSGSLKEPDGSGSDPDYARAEILAGSLSALGSLREGLTVNWGAGFFSREFEPAVSWRLSTGQSAAELASTIRAKQPGGGTNWLAGLQGVQTQLQSQPNAGSACQLVIWMTDGKIELAGDQATADAINALCGATVDPMGAPASDYGLLASLRQSGVVVLGTLLADGTTRDAASIMWPLVEGTGSYKGQAVNCGPSAAPAGAVHGAVVDASDPTALASVFLELGSRIGGGYPQPLNADGSFWIDVGVSRVQLITSDPSWTLAAPAASGLGTLSSTSSDPAVSVTASSGASLIEITVDRPDLVGAWKLTAPGTQDAYFFSDLRIVFDAQNTVQRAADGSLRATLGATVQNRDGTPADLSVYGQAVFAGTYEANGTSGDLPGATIDAATGRITLPLPAEVSAAEIVVSASLDPLVTAPHAVALAPITTEQRIATVLPAGFPSVHAPVQLSELTGRDGVAQGTLTLTGPTEGGDGQVCLTALPTITSDNADRADRWTWSFTDASDAALAAGTCVTVPQGTTQTVTVAATNDTPADASVVASLPLDIRSAAGGSVPQEITISFPSTHPVNAGAVLALTIGLLVLGVLLPLLLLYVMNRRAARITARGSFLRAAVPVEITRDGVRFLVEPGALAERFHYLPKIENQSSVADVDLGSLRARVPLWPLSAPTYVVGPPPQGLVIAAATGVRPNQAGRPRKSTQLFTSLPLDAFWAIVVRDGDLATSEAVRATAAIYHRADPSDPRQYVRRVDDLVATAGSTIWDTVQRVKKAKAQTKPPSPSNPSSGSSTEPSTRDAATVPPRTSPGLPPRPSSTPGGTVPPRAAEPPSRSGTPPRPGAAPPSHRPPPARPGS